MNSARKIEPGTMAGEAMEAALAGGRTARAVQLAGLKPRQKSADRDDLVTEGDLASQQAILALLPHSIDGEPIGMLAEEPHVAAEWAQDTSWRWVIDPIDGTLPYSRGESYWCVSVALQKRKTQGWETCLGVLYQASERDTGEILCGRLFWMQEEAGSFMRQLPHGEHLPLIRPSAPFPEVAEYNAGSTFGAWAEQEFTRLGIRMQFRRSLCYAVCELLMGENSIVLQDSGPLEWDVAASLPIAQAAGVFTCQIKHENEPCDKYAVALSWREDLFRPFAQKLAGL